MPDENECIQKRGQSTAAPLIGVPGYYALISMTINAFDVAPPPGSPLAFSEGADA